MSNVPAAFLVQRPQKVPAAFCVKRPQLVVSPPENNSATCSSQTSPSCTRRSKQVTYSRASSSSATSTRATGTEANRTRGTPTMDSHVARKALYCLGWGKTNVAHLKEYATSQMRMRSMILERRKLWRGIAGFTVELSAACTATLSGMTKQHLMNHCHEQSNLI